MRKSEQIEDIWIGQVEELRGELPISIFYTQTLELEGPYNLNWTAELVVKHGCGIRCPES
ncbi:MAG: hypothetical protein R2792_11795 [Saprospiraceae bacterium]